MPGTANRLQEAVHQIEEYDKDMNEDKLLK